MLHVDALHAEGGLGVPCPVPFQIYPIIIIIIISKSEVVAFV